MLTIHKNTRVQRKAKEVRRELISDAKNLTHHKDISGYAIVTWDSKCTADCAWYSSPPSIPGLVVPEFAKKVLERRIATNDVNDIIDNRFE